MCVWARAHVCLVGVESGKSIIHIPFKLICHLFHVCSYRWITIATFCHSHRCRGIGDWNNTVRVYDWQLVRFIASRKFITLFCSYACKCCISIASITLERWEAFSYHRRRMALAAPIQWLFNSVKRILLHQISNRINIANVYPLRFKLHILFESGYLATRSMTRHFFFLRFVSVRLWIARLLSF